MAKNPPRFVGARSIALVALLAGIYVSVNFITIYCITSYGYMLSLFTSSEHYKKVKYYQDKWNVPVMIGEYCWEPIAHNTPMAIPPWLWTRLTGFEYLVVDSMTKIANDEQGWCGWMHWEYEKVAFKDERLNEIFSKYMKGSWKPSDPIPRLVVKGKEIQTQDGSPLILKGTTLPLKYLATYSELEANEETFQNLDNMGMNVVRIVTTLDALMPQEGVWNQKSLEVLNQSLDLAEKHHIYVIPSIEQWRASPYFRYGGKGFPSWYVQRYNVGFDGDWQKFNLMWINKEPPYEDSWTFVTEAWKKIIGISKGRNIVAGYDLFSEPPGAPHRFYEYLSAQIEPFDPGKIHFANTMYIFWGMDSEDKPEIYNLVLYPHLYDVWKKELYSVMFVASVLFPITSVVFLTVFTVLRLRFKRKKTQATKNRCFNQNRR